MSLTDANAILGRGRMHVLSQEQAADLMLESLEASKVGLALYFHNRVVFAAVSNGLD
jgi:hypothetical protein